MKNCENCEAEIPGEPGELPDDADFEAEPGDWYIDGNRYTCPECGAVHVAQCDGESATLSALEEEKTNAQEG